MNAIKLFKSGRRAGLVFMMIVLSLTLCAGTVFAKIENADRAVEIAKESRDKVEQSGKMLQESSTEMFKEFARATGELQKLIDTRDQLEKAGLLSKDDPDGMARRANLNAKILMEVGNLKKVCDQNIDDLLGSLDSFDKAVSDSLVNTQATRSINSNYELALNSYIKQEKKSFDQAADNAKAALEAYQATTDPAEKERYHKKYLRIKKRLLKINQRRKLFETRIKVAKMNQKMTGVIRDRIRRDGIEVPDRFRKVMTEMYTMFSKIVPITESGSIGRSDYMAAMGFENMTKLKDTLQIVGDSTEKLNHVLDDMVNDVLAGFGDIAVVDDGSLASGAVLSTEDEMSFLSKQRQAWDKKGGN